jgi:heat shock protein HslJ
MSELRSAAALLAAGALSLAVCVPAMAMSETRRQSEASSSVASNSIEGVEWVLKRQASGGAMPDVDSTVTVTLLMSLGEASGSGGCNSYRGTYTLNGSALSFSPLAYTQMACGDPAGATEQTYFANLAHVASFTSDGTTLSLADASGTALLGYAAAPAPDIAGGWIVTGYNNGNGAVKTPVAKSILTMVFGSDGTLSGSSGCNRYSGGYSVDGSKLTVGPLASTQMACASSDLNDQEAQFLAALEASETWSQDAGGLKLTNESQLSGATTVTAIPATHEDYVGEWEVVGLNNGLGVVPPAAGRLLTAVFRSDGEVEGSTGCNFFTGPYVVNGASMSIGPLASTYAACTSTLMETQQQQYLTALQNTSTWVVDEFGGLSLRDATDALQVQFTKARGLGQ